MHSGQMFFVRICEVMKTYAVFEQLLEKRGAKIADVVRATGISFSTFADWKNGRIKQPKYERLRMIAEYFDVPVEYLLTGKMPPKESDSGKQYAFSDRAAAYAEMLTRHADLQRLVELAQDADPADVRLVTAVLERMVRNATAK